MATLGTFSQKSVGIIGFSVEFYIRIHLQEKVNTIPHCIINALPYILCNVVYILLILDQWALMGQIKGHL